MRRGLLVLLFGSLLAIEPRAQVAPQALAITNVNVVDVINGRILANHTVTIDGDTIRNIGQTIAPSPGTRVVEGVRKFLIPGLWDMHAHMEIAGESWLQLYVANGVTGIRDMGSDLEVILRMRDATDSGRLLGPRIFAAGPILDDAPGDWPFRLRVKIAEEARAAVRLLEQRGVDLIKVHSHTPRDVYFAITDEARQRNLPVGGHVPLKVTIDEAIKAGQRSIEHFSDGRVFQSCSGGNEYRPNACRPLFEQLAREGVWQTPTLTTAETVTIGTADSDFPAEKLAFAGRAIREMWAGSQKLFVTPEIVRIIRAGAPMRASVVRDMAAVGVGILAGCDTMIAGFCVHDELSLFVGGGMTPAAALRTATINPARYLGIENSAGSVEAGKRADLVLLDGNPLTDIENVRHIHAVVAAGRLLEREALDTLLDEVRAAAARDRMSGTKP